MTIVKDEDSNIHEDNEAMEIFKLEEVVPEADGDATDFDQDKVAEEADWVKVEDEALEGEGYEDHGEEEAEAIETLEEDGDDDKYHEGNERYDKYEYVYEENVNDDASDYVNYDVNDDVDDEYVRVRMLEWQQLEKTDPASWIKTEKWNQKWLVKFACMTSLGLANGKIAAGKFIWRKCVCWKSVKIKVGAKRDIQGPANLLKEGIANMEMLVGLIIDHQST